MKWRIKEVIKTLLLGPAAVALAISIGWVCAGFYHLSPNEIAYLSNNTVWVDSPERVIPGDGLWHWYAPLFQKKQVNKINATLPTFYDALAEAIVWNEKYVDAMRNYTPPKSTSDLEQEIRIIVNHMAQRSRLDAHIPQYVVFEEYEKDERYTLAGYYLDGIQKTEDEYKLAYDLLSMNQFYLEGKPWDDDTYLHTLIHELTHAQGPANAIQIVNENYDKAIGILYDSHNETITQIRSATIAAELWRAGYRQFRAAFCEAMAGHAYRAAYFLMQRAKGEYPWIAYPYYTSPEDSEVYIFVMESRARDKEEGKKVSVPYIYDRAFIWEHANAIERLYLAMNRVLITRQTAQWEQAFRRVQMNLQPSTPQRRARRTMYERLRERNPYTWSAAVYKYWWLPYLYLKISTIAEGHEGQVEWYWTQCWGWFCWGIPGYEDMLPVLYYDTVEQETANALVRMTFADRVKYEDWIDKHYHDKPRPSVDDISIMYIGL